MGILLWPESGTRKPDRILPQQTIEDLQLDRLCAFMNYNNYFKLTVNEMVQLWTDDPEVITWRQEVLKDLLENPDLEAALEELLDCLDVWENHSVTSRRAANANSGGPGLNLGDFSYLDSYLDKITRLSATFTGLTLNSRGMQGLRQHISAMGSSQRFAAIQQGFSDLCGAYLLPNRVSIGFNLDRELKPAQLKLLRIEKKTTKRRKMAFTKTAHAQTSQLLSRATGDASQAITMYVKRESMEIRSVKQDIIFYLSALKLCRAWHDRGLSYCFPEIRSMEEKAFTAKEMFNPLLVINGKEKIVPNEIDFAPGGELLILTGANQGGKTVFLLSVALTQWLFQLGLAVPAVSAALSPVEDIVTVFAPSGATFSRHGLLAEEAGRIASAVKLAGKYSLVLFNEPLNSTSPSENLHISQEVVGAFKAAGVRGIWVTHMYELAADRERVNQLISWGSTLGSIRIVVESDGTGTRPTYKIVRGEPEFNSYAAEVLKRKGV